MNKDLLKQQLLQCVDGILSILEKGNTVEVKKNKDGILILDVSRKIVKK